MTTDVLTPAPAQELTGGPVADLSNAPLPTAATLRMRQCIPVQFVKFVGFDLRIMRMVLKGHSHD